MSVQFDRGSPGKFDSRTLNRTTLNRWTGRIGFGRGGFFRVMRLALLSHPSLGHAGFRGLAPEGPPEVDSVLKAQHYIQVVVVEVYLCTNVS